MSNYGNYKPEFINDFIDKDAVDKATSEFKKQLEKLRTQYSKIENTNQLPIHMRIWLWFCLKKFQYKIKRAVK